MPKDEIFHMNPTASSHPVNILLFMIYRDNIIYLSFTIFRDPVKMVCLANFHNLLLNNSSNNSKDLKNSKENQQCSQTKCRCQFQEKMMIL